MHIPGGQSAGKFAGKALWNARKSRPRGWPEWWERASPRSQVNRCQVFDGSPVALKGARSALLPVFVWEWF